MSTPPASSVESISTALTTLYQTLVDLTYLPSRAILCPPSRDGWELTPPLPGKTTTVLTLMRHLPYLSDASGFRWHIAPLDTSPLNYSPHSAYDAPSDAQDPKSMLPIGEDEYIPRGCLPLTNGDENGTWLILDTEPAQWTITEWCPAEAEDQPEPMPGPREWRRYPTRPAEEVLREWERRFRELEWIPLRTGGGLEVVTLKRTGEDGRVRHEALQRLYRENGWPGSFNREAFRASLNELLGEDIDEDEEAGEEEDGEGGNG